VPFLVFHVFAVVVPQDQDSFRYNYKISWIENYVSNILIHDL